MADRPTIIPVASGKGGVGKSWLTANLAVILADSGANTIALDLDLGGSNLHSFLGLPNKYPGIGDYLRRKDQGLDTFAVATPFANLRFIPGDGQSLFMGNIPFAQKVKLIRAIRQLKADFVLVDLGAGSTFNNLDFFAMAASGLLVTTPEVPAMVNLMTFVKNLVFRRVEYRVRRCHPLHELVKARYVQSIEDDPLTMNDLLVTMRDRFPEYEREVRRLIERMRLRLVLNMGSSVEDASYLYKVDTTLSKRLQIGFDHYGFIPRDPLVFASIQKHEVFARTYPDSLPGLALKGIADRIARLWQRPIDRSWERLTVATGRLLARREEN